VTAVPIRYRNICTPAAASAPLLAQTFAKNSIAQRSFPGRRIRSLYDFFDQPST
jgi:hypothetical protein